MSEEAKFGYDFIIPLLKRINAHNEKVYQHEAIINPEYFSIEILDLVLDAFGLPVDNTLEQRERLGEEAANDDPATFGRDWWHDTYANISFNTEEEIWTFLETVRKDVERERWKD